MYGIHRLKNSSSSASASASANSSSSSSAITDENKSINIFKNKTQNKNNKNKKNKKNDKKDKNKKIIKIKIKIKINNRKTQKNKNNICYQTKKIIKNMISHNILRNYTKYVSTLVKQFMDNNNTMLDTIFTIKIKNQQNQQNQYNQHNQHNQHNNTHYKLTLIDNPVIPPHLQILPFIDIIKYLFTQLEFTKHFTDTEITGITNILHNTNNSNTNTNNTNTNNNSNTNNSNTNINTNNSKHIIYNYLHNNEIGQKISDIYYKEHENMNLEAQFPSVKFHKLLINSFTSYKILEDIEEHMNTLLIGSLEYNKTLYDSILYIYNNNSKHTKTSTLNNKIIERLLFFNELLQTNKLPNKLIIFLTNKKKQIDDDLEHTRHFRTLNINTAVTNHTDIIIYRKEELLKSIFHELIHFHKLDCLDIPTDINTKILRYLKKTHNIADNNTYLLYECVTETLANVLNNIYNTYGSTKTQQLQQFNTNFVDEIIFSTFQVAKILKICKYTSFEEFSQIDKYNNSNRDSNSDSNRDSNRDSDNDSDNDSDIDKQFKQDSCVFNYYILKLYILLNIDTYFANILDKQLKFIPSQDNFSKLIDIFEKGRNNIHLASIINAILKNNKNTITTNKNTITQNNSKTMSNSKYNNITRHINKTLKMTCIE